MLLVRKATFCDVRGEIPVKGSERKRRRERGRERSQRVGRERERDGTCIIMGHFKRKVLQTNL